MRAGLEGREAGAPVSIRTTRVLRPRSGQSAWEAGVQPDDHAEGHVGEGSAKSLSDVRDEQANPLVESCGTGRVHSLDCLACCGMRTEASRDQNADRSAARVLHSVGSARYVE